MTRTMTSTFLRVGLVLAVAASSTVAMPPNAVAQSISIAPAQGQQLVTTFVTTGSGFTANGNVRRFVYQPGWAGFTEISSTTADSGGRISFPYTPGCDHPAGTTRMYLVDRVSGRGSNEIQYGVSVNQSCRPTIMAISPGAPTAGATDQLVTVTGTRFMSGQTVTVGFPGGGTGTLSGSQVRNVTPTSFQMVVTLADPGSYWLRVNTNGGASSQFSFSVNAASTPPSVTAINPSMPTAGTANQLVTVTGTRFTAGLTVTIGFPGGGSGTLSGSQIRNVTATSFQMVVTLADPGAYWLRVNTSGGSSSQYAFSATAASALPTVTAISPGTPTAGTANQVVTVIGAHFLQGQTVTVGFPGGGSGTLSGSQITNVSPTSFRMVVTLADPGAYWVRVNTSSGASTQFAFSVTAGGPPPTVTATAPSRPPAGPSDQAVTVTGSGFVNGLSVTVGFPGGGTGLLTGSQISQVSPTTFRMLATFANPGTYWLVVNTARGSSSRHHFIVGSDNVGASTGDDYPYPGRPCRRYAPDDADEWRFFFGECTSFVAWRINRDAGTKSSALNNLMNNRLGRTLPSNAPPGCKIGRLSDAQCWAAHLEKIGYAVNSTPAVGAIAHWTAAEIGNDWGHVAYVSAVDSDGRATVEEYNFKGTCQYSWRRVAAPRYIHVNAGNTAVTTLEPAQPRVPVALATSGGVVQVAFDGVSTRGTATVVHQDVSPESLGVVPSGLVPLTPSVFDVKSSSPFGTVDVCLKYTSSQLAETGVSEGTVAMMHLSGGDAAWTVVPSISNLETGQVCANVTSLSHFALAGTASTTRYLAEGSTSAIFDTRIALLNPTESRSETTLEFLTASGTPVSQTVEVPARTRVTIDPRATLGTSPAEFSTVVRAGTDLVVDRTMTWGASGYGSHAETAVRAPSAVWYLAEGATLGGFDLFYLLQNPSTLTTRVRVRYLLPSGPPLVKDYELPPTSRTNIWVNAEEFPGLGRALANSEMSAEIESLDGIPIIVERAMYRSNQGRTFNAGHASMGVAVPSAEWFLAEGATGPYFDLFVLIANPNDEDAFLTVKYLLPDGTVHERELVAKANSRSSIWVDHEQFPGVPGRPLSDTAVSTTITSRNAVPVVVERAMWWPGASDTWHEAHNSPGSTMTGTRWALAEGEVGGSNNQETYVLIANVSQHVGSAKVTLMYEDGSSSSRVYALPARSRSNVAVRNDFPGANGRRFGVVVESTGASPAQIVVERAMYSDAEGVAWAAGSNALATRIR